MDFGIKFWELISIFVLFDAGEVFLLPGRSFDYNRDEIASRSCGVVNRFGKLANLANTTFRISNITRNLS